MPDTGTYLREVRVAQLHKLFGPPPGALLQRAGKGVLDDLYNPHGKCAMLCTAICPQLLRQRKLILNFISHFRHSGLIPTDPFSLSSHTHAIADDEKDFS